MTQANKSSRAAVALALDGGETPFSIMLKTARALWKKAAPDGEHVEDIELAKDAAEVAAKAAPYVHPKLAAMQLEYLDGGKGEAFTISFDSEDRNA